MAGGIDAARILLLPASHHRERDVSLTGVVDVILDTMPSSDYFSARAAIHDAIPFVTIPGRPFQERVGLSLLTHLGDRTTVAASGRDYVELAAKMVLDLAVSASSRVTIAAHRQSLLAQSPLADINQYVAHLEDALFRVVGAQPETLI